MIKKQSLWFLTLISLILVVSVYYISIPKDSVEKTTSVLNESDEEDVIVSDVDILESLRVNLNTERENKKKELNSSLNDSKLSSEEKNSIYEELKIITSLTSEEIKLEEKIKEKYKIDCFIKKEDNNITVVIKKEKHDVKLANNIMRTIQEEYKERVVITIQVK